MISFRRQQRLIQQCIEDRMHLRDALTSKNLSYEDLTYRLSRRHEYGAGVPVHLQDCILKKHGIPAVSFFSGAGGLDLGFEAGGFNHIGSFEFNEVFCQTLRVNRPLWNVFNEDINDHERVVSIMRQRLGVKPPFEGIFHGGPPCQSFSVASNQRYKKGTSKFKRTGFKHSQFGNLLFEFIFYIREFRPKYFLIENVPGLQDIDGGHQLEYAIKEFSRMKYGIIGPLILNAADYGVPQERRRLFIIGARSMKRSWAMPETCEQVACGRVLTANVRRYPGHITREHEAESIARYAELDYGQREHLGRVDRLDPSIPAKTVIAGGTHGGGRSHLHPDIPRTLSPRETARLQTFPDCYLFEGPPARQLTQIGNAVPPVLAAMLARQIASIAGVSILESQRRIYWRTIVNEKLQEGFAKSSATR